MVLPWGVDSVALDQAVAWVDSRLLLVPLPLLAVDLSPVDRLLLRRALQVLPGPLQAKVQHPLHPAVREARAANRPPRLRLQENLWLLAQGERPHRALPPPLLQMAPHRPKPGLRLPPLVAVAQPPQALPAEPV